MKFELHTSFFLQEIKSPTKTVSNYFIFPPKKVPNLETAKMGQIPSSPGKNETVSTHGRHSLLLTNEQYRLKIQNPWIPSVLWKFPTGSVWKVPSTVSYGSAVKTFIAVILFVPTSHGLGDSRNPNRLPMYWVTMEIWTGYP